MKLKIALLEKADETGRSMILRCSEDGDVSISAPNGRVHFLSKYFSREVGGAGGGSISSAPPRVGRRISSSCLYFTLLTSMPWASPMENWMVASLIGPVLPCWAAA